MVDAKNELRVTADMHDELRAVRDDLQRLRSDMSDLAKDVVTLTKAEVGALKQKVQDTAKLRVEQLSDVAQGAKERSERTLNDTRNWIQERPILAVAGALAAGVLVGKLLRSRS